MNPLTTFIVGSWVMGSLMVGVIILTVDDEPAGLPGHLIAVPTTMEAAARYNEEFVDTGAYGARFIHCDDLPAWVVSVDTELAQRHAPILCYVEGR